MITRVQTNLKVGAQVNLGPKTLIVGPRGSGKSTIVNAIELALTGRCGDVAGRDDVGAGTELWSLAPEGHDALFATAAWADGVVSAWKMTEGRKPMREGPVGVLPLREVREALVGSAETTRKWLLQFVGGGAGWRADLGGSLAERASALPDDLATAIEAARQRGREARSSATRLRESAKANAVGLVPAPSVEEIRAAQEAEGRRAGAARIADLVVRREALVADRAAADARLREADERLRSIPPDDGLADQVDTVLAAMAVQISRDAKKCAVCGGETTPGAVTARRDALLQKAKALVESNTMRAEAAFAAGAAAADLKRIDATLAALPEGDAEVPPAPPVSSSELLARQSRWSSVEYASREAASAEREADEWQAIVDLLALRLSQSVEDGKSAFEARVQQYLPTDMTFGISLQPVRVGLKRGTALHTALSGAEWATVTLAIALAAAEQNADSAGRVVAIPEERAFDPDTLRDVLSAWTDAPIQIIVTSPVMPRSVPEGWTVITRGDSVHSMIPPVGVATPIDLGGGPAGCACPTTASGRKRHAPGCPKGRRKAAPEAAPPGGAAPPPTPLD